MTARPPLEFGAVWRHAGTHLRYGNELSLWLADQLTQQFLDAYRGAREQMIGAGFSWTEKGHDGPGMRPCWWDLGQPLDLCAIANAADLAIQTAAATRDEAARATKDPPGARAC